MSDDKRVYNDEEFALILRKAAELENRAKLAAPSSAGLTLTEMKAAAAQVGFDPALVERAARLLADRVNASPTERLIGGPFRHEYKVRLPIKLDENSSAGFFLPLVSARASSAARMSDIPTRWA